MSSIKPDDSGSHVDGAEECGGPFIVSGGNTSKLREVCEEIFHQMPDFLQVFIVYTLHFPVRLWRAHRLHSGIFPPAHHTLLRVISFVGQHGVPLLQEARQQRVRACQIRRLSGRERNAAGMAQRLTGCMDLGGQSTC